MRLICGDIELLLRQIHSLLLVFFFFFFVILFCFLELELGLAWFGWFYLISTERTLNRPIY